MAQSDSLPDEVAAKIAKMDKRLRDLERTPQLTRSSIDDGRLVSKDRDGRVREVIGKQVDGSHGSRVVESPAQPTPSAPVLKAGDAGVVSVKWDGGADGPVPLVHGHLEVVAESPSGVSEVVSTIRDRDGGATSFVADEAGTWSVHLVMVGQDRATRSEPSQVSTIEVVMPVDGDAIQAELDQAAQDLADAEAEWETARQGLRSDLDELNQTTIPALESDLSANSTAISAAEARLDQAETDLSTAQQNVDDLQNTTIPAVEQNLSDAEAAWEQSKTDLQSGLDQINNSTIPVIRDDVDANATAITQAAQDAQAEYDRLQEDAQRQIDALIERGDNLVVNGSFEKADPNSSNNLYGWSRNNTSSGTRETDTARTGEASVRLASPTSGDVPATILSTWWASSGRRIFRVRAWVTHTSLGDDDTAGFQAAIRVSRSDGSTSTLWGQQTGSGFGVGAGFAEFVEDHVTIDDDSVSQARVMVRALPGSGVYRVDDVEVHDITEAAEALEAANQAEQAAQNAHAAAGDAWDYADTAMTRAGQVGSRMGGETTPTGTAPENSIWFQWSDMDDPNRTVLGVWQMIDGNWTEQDSSDPALIPTVDIGAATVGTLKAVRIDVASLFVDTQFVNDFHAETVEALRVTAETGFIGGVHLADNSVGARQVIASEVGAEVGTFVEIDAGQVTTGLLTSAQIDVQELAAQTAAVIELDADRITTGKLGAARIDVQQLMAQSAVIDTIHTESVEALKLTGEVGFIGGVLLENGAVTTEKLTVTSDMTAAIANFLEVKAVHIDANDIVTNSALVGELEAHGITLSSEVNNRRFEISGDGWVLTDTSTSETLAKVSSDGTILMRDAQIEGTFQTAYPNGAGVTISRGAVTYWSAEQNQMVTRSETPYMRLTPRDGEKDRDPVIATDGQRLVLAGGRDSDGVELPVVMDGKLEGVNAQFSHGLVAGALNLIDPVDDTPSTLTKFGIKIDQFASQPTGIERNNSRTQLVGRMADLPGSTTLMHIGTSSNYWDVPAGGSHRVNYSLSNPAPFGTRKALVTAQVSSGSLGWDNARAMFLSVTKEGAGGFSTVGRAPSDNGGDVRYMINHAFGWK